MELKDILDLEKALFHPDVSFPGEWMLENFDLYDNMNESYMVMNSKKNGKNNKFLDYLDNNYYKAFDRHMNLKGFANNFQPFILFGENKNGRCVNFSFTHFVVQNLYSLSNKSTYRTKFKDNVEVIEGIEEALVSYLRDALRDERNKLVDVQKNGANSEFYSEYLEIIEFQGINNWDFDKAIAALIESHTKRIVGCRYYLNFFQKEIDLQALMECYDFDTFCLILAKGAIEAMYSSDLNDNAVDNSSQFLYLYFNAVDELRKTNPNYNPTIIVTNIESKQKEIIGVEDLRKVFNNILVKHPSFSFVEYDVDQLLVNSEYTKEELEAMDKIDSSRIIYELFERAESFRKLRASWQIIAKGEKTLENVNLGVDSFKEKNKPSLIEADESLRRTMIGHQFLENSNYLFKMYGLNEFEGYCAYIFPTTSTDSLEKLGKVILEWQPTNDSKKRNVKYNATYVMNLGKFIDFSKLSRHELVKRISSGKEKGVRRIYHKQNMEVWKTNVRKQISGQDYTTETMNYINYLLSSEVVTKKLGEK